MSAIRFSGNAHIICDLIEKSITRRQKEYKDHAEFEKGERAAGRKLDTYDRCGAISLEIAKLQKMQTAFEFVRDAIPSHYEIELSLEELNYISK